MIRQLVICAMLVLSPLSWGQQASLEEQAATEAQLAQIAAELKKRQTAIGQRAEQLSLTERQLRQLEQQIAGKDDEGRVVKEWPAVSGKPGSTDDDQAIEDYGPIPEGEYTLNAESIQNWNDISGFNKALAYIGRGTWPGGKAAWGESRIWMTPTEGVDSFGRSGFSIHGGNVPGSAGCIDLTINMNDFTQHINTYFQQSQNQNSIILKVKY